MAIHAMMKWLQCNTVMGLRLLTLVILPAAFQLGLSSLASAQTTRPATDRRMLIVSIDGLRPDLMLRARTPYLREVFESGSFSFWARTTPHSITLPSHVSMLTGVVPYRHGIEWNKDLPLSEPVYPSVPTLFELAKKAGYSTAMTTGKSKFSALNKPGTIDTFYAPTDTKSDNADVAEKAIETIRSKQPQVMFVHLPGVDNAGHKYGWSSPEQRAAIENADGVIGALLRVLEEQKLRDKTVLLITSDHGGAGRSHLADDPRARHIPWILSGPGVRKNLDLTIFPELVINTEDTFATTCFILNIPTDKRLDGKPVKHAMENGEQDELLTAAD